jgi:hypothetical protein
MFLAGADQESFAAPEEMQGELYRVRPMESYDTMCARGRFPGGLRFMVALTHATQELHTWKLEVRGTSGSACIFEDESEAAGYQGARFALSPFKETIVESYRDFLDFAQGLRPRAPSRLEDTRGFLLASNGALLSSGGIQDIDPSLSRTYQVDGDSGYDLPDLPGYIDEAFDDGLLFSEARAQWARKTEPVSVRDLKFTPFDQYASKPHSQFP